MQDTPLWKIYERVVASLEVDAASMEASVTPNASLLGRLSGVKRQIDVLIDARWDEGLERRIIFDAKRRSRKIDVKDVEAFEGLMRDVGAARGVLVGTKGHTKTAFRRAQELIDIRLLNEEEALELDYSAVDPCPHCAEKPHKPRGVVFWDGQFPIPIGPFWSFVFTGKCDACRSFSFWCWECGEKLVVPDGKTHTCACDRRWFTETNNEEVLFIVALEDGEIPLDRRPLK
jgi:hypothetical protein